MILQLSSLLNANFAKQNIWGIGTKVNNLESNRRIWDKPWEKLDEKPF